MKILIVSLSNRGGGASRAVDRLATALARSNIEVTVLLFQGEPSLNYKTIFIYHKGLDKLIFRLKVKLTKWFMRLFSNPSYDYRSINVLPSKLLRVINEFDADLVNIHWIGAEMLSIEQMAKLKKPVVWTLHDAWMINGVYHVSPTDFYPYKNERGNNWLDSWVYKRKEKAYSKVPMHFITPSNWIKERFEASPLYKAGDTCKVIHNLIDETLWQPLDKHKSKRELGFSTSKTHVLYIANNAINVFNKGYAFFVALANMCDDSVVFHLVGTREVPYVPHMISHGKISNTEELVKHYSAADICLIPSLSENMPYTAVESLMCGTPILCFDTTGLSEIVQTGINGYKADKFDIDSLYRGLQYLKHFNAVKPITDTIPDFNSALNERRYIGEYERIIATIEKSKN